jgi:ubiquinone/menaquinone biosynthesis C-methylase UbiE
LPLIDRKLSMEFVVRLKVETNKNSSDAEYVFDIFAERYDKWYETPFGKSAFRLEKTCIESLCENLKQPFLEIGVGTGRFAETLKIEYGIDISAGVLKFAKKRGLAVIRGKGEKLPFIDKSFGAVFIIVTLCFVDEPLKVLVEAARVLRDNGGIILGLILRGSPWASFYKKKGEAGNVFYKIAKFYSFKELKAMVEKAGLKSVETRSAIFQVPTEDPLRFEPPRKGYFEKAGFIAVKLGKIN